MEQDIWQEAEAADAGVPDAEEVSDAPPVQPETEREDETSGVLDRPGPEFERELEAIRALDPQVRGFADIPRMESFPRFIELAQKGFGFLDAFRAANFDAIVERRAKAARQEAVNELRSTRHMEPVGGAAEPVSDMTQEELDWWKAFGFSEKKARYYHEQYKKER